MRIHRRVRVDLRVALLWRAAADVIDMRLGMHAQQRGLIGKRRRLALDQGVDAAGDQLILDCLKTRGAFGMPLAHLVKQTIWMGIKGGSHDSLLRRVAQARGVSPVQGAPARRTQPHQVTTPSVRTAPLQRFCTVLQWPSGILPRILLPPSVSFALRSQFTMTFKLALSVRTGFAPCSGHRALRRMVRVRGRQSGRGTDQRAQTAPAGRAGATATGGAARPDLRRRNRAAALRKQSGCRRFHQRYGGALRLRSRRTAYLFTRVSYSATAVKLVTPSPTPSVKNWRVYQSRFLDPVRINAGVRFWRNNQATLQRASDNSACRPR